MHGWGVHHINISRNVGHSVQTNSHISQVVVKQSVALSNHVVKDFKHVLSVLPFQVIQFLNKLGVVVLA
jgi:hypothetical protein